jgi:diguanylate cyclase
MPTGSERDRQRKPPRFRLNRALHACVDWLVAGPRAQPSDIRNQLLHQSLTKKRTLIVSVVATSLMASIAAVLTAAPWAYAWLLAELLIGGTRLWLMSAFAKAEPSRRNRNVIAPILAGLAAFVVVSTGGYLCVGSGQWALISMAAMGLAGMVGAVSSRNAGTPRYGVLLICILTAPFSLASLVSPIPHLFILGIQLPLYACGVIFVMLDNYKVLLNLYGSEHENRKLAQYDPLTGLPNRIMNLKRFNELLARAPVSSDKMQKELTVFCLDLDGFKDVNDRYGHAAGDALLIALADRLRDCVRTLDFVSRIGGDEFVILLPAISPAEAAVIAKRIIACVEAPFEVGLPAPVHVGISIGSACAPDDGKTADALLRSADRAMYEAKRRGKGLFVTLNSLEGEPVELAPAADADAPMAGAFGESGDGNRHFPLPFGSKSL